MYQLRHDFGGYLIARTTHAELLAKDGVYARLRALQFAAHPGAVDAAILIAPNWSGPNDSTMCGIASPA